MKTVKIPTDEKDFKKFLDNFMDYGKRRGVHVYAILAYSPMVGAAMSVIPQLTELPPDDAQKFLNLWADATLNLKEQMENVIDKVEGAVE